MTITVTIEIAIDQIASLLGSALESSSGSKYWYRIEEFIEPERFTYRTDPETIFRHIDYPLNPGGSLIISAFGDDDEDLEIKDATRWRVDLDSIRQGLEVMAKSYPLHFASLVNENADAITGDVFLQCVCFGEVIFG